jgi:hypothetical protein
MTDSNKTESQLTLFAGDSPVRTSAPQEDKLALVKARDQDYGQNAAVYLGSFDQNTPYLRTSQTCLMETEGSGFSRYSGTFPRSGMMRNGTVYQLPNLAHTTTEIGSGLWSTPTKHLQKEGGCPAEYERNSPTLTAEAIIGAPYRELEQSIYSEAVSDWQAAKSVNGCVGQIWQAEPKLGRVVDGVWHKSYGHRLGALGNAVVPQIPEIIGRAIMVVEGF